MVPETSQPARYQGNPAVAEISNEIVADPSGNSGRVNIITQDSEPLEVYDSNVYDDQHYVPDLREHVAQSFLEDLAPPMELEHPGMVSADVQTEDYSVRMLKFARERDYCPKKDLKLSQQFQDPYHIKVISKPSSPKNPREDRSSLFLQKEKGRQLTKSLENLPIDSFSFLAVYRKRMERGLYSTPSVRTLS